MTRDIKKSIINELEKNPDGETTVQIRLFDDRTGKVFYKHLTQKELARILGIWEKMTWR